jgi:hypothetical protein
LFHEKLLAPFLCRFRLPYILLEQVRTVGLDSFFHFAYSESNILSAILDLLHFYLEVVRLLFASLSEVGRLRERDHAHLVFLHQVDYKFVLPLDDGSIFLNFNFGLFKFLGKGLLCALSEIVKGF